MAIDSRIALAITPLNIGERFGQNIQNLRNVDLLNQRRDIAPLQLEQAQRANELGIAQQPALLQQAELSATPEAQEANRIGILQEISNDYAKGLKQALSTNNPEQVKQFIQQKIQSYSSQKIGADILKSIQGDIAQLDTPTGMQELLAEADSVLTPISSLQRTAGQREFESKTQGLSEQQKQDAILINLGLKPRATGSAAQTIAATGATQDVAKSEAIIEGTKEKAKQSAQNVGKAVGKGLEIGVKAFEKMPSVRTAITNYSDAIAALDAGAETGIIDRLLPSFSEAGKNLENTIKRLGLDVVGNTTFGALSESELAFALKAAIPDNLQPAELKKWLVAKKKAQEKLLAGLDEMSNFLGDGTKTLVDWNNRQALNKFNEEESATPTAPAQPSNAVNIGRFTVEEVN